MNARPHKADLSAVEAKIYHLTRPLVHPINGMEIIFILDGQARVSTDGMMRMLKNADLLALRHAKRCRIAPVSDCFLLAVRIGHSFLSSFFGRGVPSFDCDSAAKAGRDYSVLRRILAEIAYSDALESETGNRFLLHSRIFRLFDELERNFTSPDDDAADDSSEIGQRRRAIRIYMNENFRSQLTLGNLADSLSLTPQYLSKFFKKQLGINFHEYLNKLRVESALKDLVFSDASVTTVAYDNGYPNLTSFSSAVKERTGLSPTHYRKAHAVRADVGNEFPEEPQDPVDIARVRDMVIPYVGEKNVKAISPHENRKTLEISANQGGPLEYPWKEVLNLGFAPDFIKSDFLSHIELLQGAVKFKYARFQGLFGKSMILAKGSTLEPSFAKLDRLIDFLYAAGLIPFIELGFKPEKINKNSSNHIFYKGDEFSSMPLEEYEKLLADFLKHAINRYGASEVGKWRFEFWAECDEELHYAQDAVPKYIEGFTRIRKTIKGVSPSSMLGGPGFNAAADIEVLGEILRALRARNSSPDFLSFYLFSFRTLPPSAEEAERDLPVLWSKTETLEKIAWIKEYASSCDPGLNAFYATEWNLDFSCRNLVHDSLLKAPFILQNAIDSIGRIDALAYWLASDISAEYDDSDAILFGGAGIISRYAIRKPAFFAFEFLSRLGGKLIAKGDGYIVTAKSEVEFVAVIFNYKYLNDLSRLRDRYRDLSSDISNYLENLDDLAVSLLLKDVKAGRYKVRQHILNSRFGSVLDAWKRLSWVEDLHRSDVNWLDRVCIPALKIDFLDCRGTIPIECVLEPNEVRLLEISLYFS